MLKAAQGEKGVIEPTFVDSPLYKDQGVDFFASKVELGPAGVEKIYDVGKLTQHEESLLQACLTGKLRLLLVAKWRAFNPSRFLSDVLKLTGFSDLAKNINKGVQFVKENP